MLITVLWLCTLCVVLARPELNYKERTFTKWELDEYKAEVKELIYFGLDEYLGKGFPYDEIRPISCKPKTRNFKDLYDTGTNDVLGNFTTTLIDSLTTVAVLGDRDRFKSLVDLVDSTYPNGFDMDSTVQVFETTIRIIGGLLSSHLYATDPSKKVYLGKKDYNGCLLKLAKDMGDRLLPSYLTKTGLPVPRINLKYKFHGITPDLVNENNAAALSCPMFEFTLLSYLTHDAKYEEITKYAFKKTWDLRSEIGLVPMSFNPQYSYSFGGVTGIGASIDSFYEYALKGSILFDDNYLLDVWHSSYDAIRTHAKEDWYFNTIGTRDGHKATNWVDSLSAFFPGLQVLAGNIEDSVYQHMLFLKLWDTFGGIPERWMMDGIYSFRPLELPWYPLRPEFVESTYFLYRATKDPFYLNVGYRILQDFKFRFKKECGFGGMQDLISGEPQDRMETFVLSETLKYLYLLFDEENEIHADRGNIIFSTEAHPMWITYEMKRDYNEKKFFTDKTYLEHLEEVQLFDWDKKLRDNNEKNKELLNKYADVLKRINKFRNKTKEELSGLMKEKKEELEENGIVESHNAEIGHSQFKDVCKVSKYRQNDTGFSFSNIMSSFKRISEPERIFNTTLIKPNYLDDYAPFEFDKKFYDRWCPHNASSSLAATTLPFDIVLELPGQYELYQYPNGTVNAMKLGNKRKLRLERITRGDIDVYGEFVSDADFSGVSWDLVRQGNAKYENGTALKNNKSLYRVVKIDGVVIPRKQMLFVNSTLFKEVVSFEELYEDPEILHKRDILRAFGFNKDGYLIFNDTVVSNCKII